METQQYRIQGCALKPLPPAGICMYADLTRFLSYNETDLHAVRLHLMLRICFPCYVVRFMLCGEVHAIW